MTFCPGSCLEPGQKGTFRPGWSHQPGQKVSHISPLPPPSPSHSFSSLRTRRSARNHHDAVRLPDSAAVLLLLQAPPPPDRRPSPEVSSAYRRPRSTPAASSLAPGRRFSDPGRRFSDPGTSPTLTASPSSHPHRRSPSPLVAVTYSSPRALAPSPP